jgi:TonB family protein
MKKLILLLLLSASRILVASTDPALKQTLASATNQANLFQQYATPFQIDVDFSAQMRVPMEGHLTIKWEGNERWWRKVVIGDFHEVDVRNGNRLYISRNAPVTPVRVDELIELLHFPEHFEHLQVKKQKLQTENGIEMSCLEVKGEKSRTRSHKVCLDSLSHDILSEEWKEPLDEQRKEQFSEFVEFGTRRYPRKLELFVDGSKAISAQVESLTTSALDASLLVPPKGAIERRQCADMKHAVPIHTPDPLYPRSASQNGLMGDTTVSMTVLADGSVSDIQLLGSATHSMDEASLRTLSSWKFKPAMCGTEPVDSDIRVVVSFRLQ